MPPLPHAHMPCPAPGPAAAASKLQFTGARAADAAASLAMTAADGLPSPHSRMTGRQQQAVANLLRVQAAVAQFVAKHDEDRITVRGEGGLLACSGVGAPLCAWHRGPALAQAPVCLRGRHARPSLHATGADPLLHSGCPPRRSFCTPPAAATTRACAPSWSRGSRWTAPTTVGPGRRACAAAHPAPPACHARSSALTRWPSGRSVRHATLFRRRAHRADAGVCQGLPGDGAAAAGGGGQRQRKGQLWRHRHVGACACMTALAPLCLPLQRAGLAGGRTCCILVWLSRHMLRCDPSGLQAARLFVCLSAGGRRASMGRTTASTSCCRTGAGAGRRGGAQNGGPTGLSITLTAVPGHQKP